MAITVLVADDHPLLRRGLVEFLSEQAGIVVVRACDDGSCALACLQRHRPAVAVVDMNMPGLNGLELLMAARAAGIETRFILFAASLSDSEIFELTNTGAAGVLLKDAAPEAVLDCIRTIVAGGHWVTEGAVALALTRETQLRTKASRVWGALTEREQAVALLAVHKLSNLEIAVRLGIAEGTVKIHLNRVYKKGGFDSREELSLLASYGSH